MRHDIGQFIALIAVASGAVVFALSYVAAYMVGKAHGRREEESTTRVDQADANRRLHEMEATVRGLASTLDRVMDAQRLLVAQQDHLSRKVGLSSERMGLNPPHSRHTPS